MLKHVEIFIDGSCLINPGPGGYGIIMRYGKYEKIFSKGFYMTTNNRMEIMAAIASLEILTKPCIVMVNTDSQYLRQGITQWMYFWKTRDWKTTTNKPLKNIDLWKKLDIIIKNHEVYWNWVKGHAGHAENERCDKLARSAAKQPTLNDIGYHQLI